MRGAGSSVSLCVQSKGGSDQVCDVEEKLCIHVSYAHVGLFAWIYTCTCAGSVYFLCVRGHVVYGRLFNRNCHIEAIWRPGAITSCVLEYFLNCSEMFRASPNDFHNCAVTWPFMPCEKNPALLNSPLHLLNQTEELLCVAFTCTSVIPSLFPPGVSWVCNFVSIQM